MIKLMEVMLGEKFEIPPDLEKQVVDATKAAIGRVMVPYYQEKIKKLLRLKNQLERQRGREFTEFERILDATEERIKEMKPLQSLATPRKVESSKQGFKTKYGTFARFDFPIKTPDGKSHHMYVKVVPTVKSLSRLRDPDYYGQFGIHLTLVIAKLDGGAKERYMRDRIQTAKHEARHLWQFKGKKGTMMGLPKRSLRWSKDPDIRGSDIEGTATKESPYKDPFDKDKRVQHALRTIEFKTNLYNYADEIKEILAMSYPESRWSEGFKQLVHDVTGKAEFPKNTKGSLYWKASLAKQNLGLIYKVDKPKFIQYVKELYKLLFGD